jgi:hypothetical protein
MSWRTFLAAHWGAMAAAAADGPTHHGEVYCAYYQQSRTHLSLNKDGPIPRQIAAPGDGSRMTLSMTDKTWR